MHQYVRREFDMAIFVLDLPYRILGNRKVAAHDGFHQWLAVEFHRNGYFTEHQELLFVVTELQLGIELHIFHSRREIFLENGKLRQFHF